MQFFAICLVYGSLVIAWWKHQSMTRLSLALVWLVFDQLKEPWCRPSKDVYQGQNNYPMPERDLKYMQKER